MNKENWQQQIDDFTLALERITEQYKAESDYRSGNTMDWRERQQHTRKFQDARKKLEQKIKYRVNKLAALDGPPIHKDVFGTVFAVGQRVAWSSSSRYSGAQLGWVTGITPKMIKVSQLRSWMPDTYGTALYPKALIICDAILEAQGKTRAPDGYFWRED